MKKIFKIGLAFFIIFCCNKMFAQEKSNINIEISKPIIEESIFNRYLFDIGTGYNIRKNKFFIGGSLNMTYSKLNTKELDTKTFFIKPRISVSYSPVTDKRVTVEPKIGIGYSIIYMNSKKYDFTDYQYGINGLLELKINYNTKKILAPYFVVSYDYMYLKKDENFTQLNYYRNIHLINLGIGVKIKFYEKDEN
ncbi:MAG TPA: hypothetical protein PLE59_01090 [Bacteroidales bacterium]|jgi:hypothetical protein|nr:hypothetical protein [Patescibacteria group bacterium]HOF06419.1 hypothetical protein [Bacteroidales bacterium]HON96671.1 hypothetical protein [Bacteroidales bacterium]HOS19613.1 hypothetical protein [Bacteroidales bacterium]HOV55359.1 hypothetical protein [Bacteroidales bacterium]